MQVQQTASGLWVPDRKIHTAPALGGKPGAVTMARRRASAWDPSMLADQDHRWDMEGTITAATDVTQVNDIIGTAHLVPGDDNAPLYVASDADLGSRKAAQHEKASVEALSFSFTSIPQPFTWWIVYTHDALGDDHEIMGPVATNLPELMYSFGGTAWRMGLPGEDRDSTVTTPATNTAYLMVATFNGTSSEMYVNDVDQAVSGSTAGTDAHSSMMIGCGSQALYGSISWTIAGITSATMSSGDRTSLYNWAVANCGV